MAATLGTTTPNRFENVPEAHKLSIEFVVATGQNAYKGDPVVQNADGTVQAAAINAPKHTIIGVALQDAAAGKFVTVAMRAYCVVFGEAAAATLAAGFVKMGVWNATTKRREYAAGTGTDDADKNALAVGWNLTPATLDGDEIKVAIIA